ncbi:hypothetical protein DPSP01_003640 [Paraphaeosphaeria sporulosa]
MSDPRLKAELYQMIRTELKTIRIPVMKKVADELETTFDDWYLKVFSLSSEVNTGDDAKMVEEIRKAEAAVEKYEKVMVNAAPKLR